MNGACLPRCPCPIRALTNVNNAGIILEMKSIITALANVCIVGVTLLSGDRIAIIAMTDVCLALRADQMVAHITAGASFLSWDCASAGQRRCSVLASAVTRDAKVIIKGKSSIACSALCGAIGRARRSNGSGAIGASTLKCNAIIALQAISGVACRTNGGPVRGTCRAESRCAVLAVALIGGAGITHFTEPKITDSTAFSTVGRAIAYLGWRTVVTGTSIRNA